MLFFLLFFNCNISNSDCIGVRIPVYVGAATVFPVVFPVELAFVTGESMIPAFKQVCGILYHDELLISSASERERSLVESLLPKFLF